jgi:S-adenosylmethionine hydrolase
VQPIVLLTDFGNRDPYVASMKGVIAARCAAPIHDLSHDIAPHDVFEAAWFVHAVGPLWPEGTIFVCVVDPGVGTARRILAIESAGRIFLAPDNGLLSLMDAQSIVSVENESFFLPNGSTTFHGRDRFAPVAAAIVNGAAISDLGPNVDAIVRLDYTPPSYDAEPVLGRIVSVDRFGNAITDVERARIPFESFALQVHYATISRMASTYEGREPFLIVGSSGTIEISVAGGSAADVLHLRRGDPVEIIRT